MYFSRTIALIDNLKRDIGTKDLFGLLNHNVVLWKVYIGLVCPSPYYFWLLQSSQHWRIWIFTCTQFACVTAAKATTKLNIFALTQIPRQQPTTNLNIFALTQIPRSRVPASILGSGRKKASINSIRLSCKIYYILLFILLSLPPQKWNIFCFQGSMNTMSQLLKSLFFKLQTSSEEEIHQVHVRYVRQTPQSWYQPPS